MRRRARFAGFALALGLAGAAPDSADVAPFVVEDWKGLQMTIAAPGDYTPHAQYVEATARHACQPSLGAQAHLVNSVAGQPFPFSEWAKQTTGQRADLPPGSAELEAGTNAEWAKGC
jgi:hypothetical protein